MTAKAARKRRQFKVFFHEAYCKGCGICSEMCPKETLRIGERLGPLGYFLAEVQNISTCNGCRYCEIACPDMAVTVVEVEQ